MHIVWITMWTTGDGKGTTCRVADPSPFPVVVPRCCTSPVPSAPRLLDSGASTPSTPSTAPTVTAVLSPKREALQQFVCAPTRRHFVPDDDRGDEKSGLAVRLHSPAQNRSQQPHRPQHQRPAIRHPGDRSPIDSPLHAGSRSRTTDSRLDQQKCSRGAGRVPIEGPCAAGAGSSSAVIFVIPEDP